MAQDLEGYAVNDANDLQKLGRWLLIIQNELIRLRIHRHYFREVWDVFAQNKRLTTSNDFFVWMWEACAVSLSMFVRRLIDRRKGVVSLGRVLDESKSNLALMNRVRVMERFGKIDGDTATIAVEKFNEYVGSGSSCITKGQIESDRLLLRESSEKIKRYIDNHVAHYGKDRKAENLPKTDDVEHCLASIERLFRKYYFLITGNIAGEEVDPASYLIHDWKEIFTFPWIEDGNGNQK